jgi:hypothetical protein
MEDKTNAPNETNPAVKVTDAPAQNISTENSSVEKAIDTPVENILTVTNPAVEATDAPAENFLAENITLEKATDTPVENVLTVTNPAVEATNTQVENGSNPGAPHPLGSLNPVQTPTTLEEDERKELAEAQLIISQLRAELSQQKDDKEAVADAIQEAQVALSVAAAFIQASFHSYSLSDTMTNDDLSQDIQHSKSIGRCLVKIAQAKLQKTESRLGKPTTCPSVDDMGIADFLDPSKRHTATSIIHAAMKNIKKAKRPDLNPQADRIDTYQGEDEASDQGEDQAPAMTLDPQVDRHNTYQDEDEASDQGEDQAPAMTLDPQVDRHNTYQDEDEDLDQGEDQAQAMTSKMSGIKMEPGTEDLGASLNQHDFEESFSDTPVKNVPKTAPKTGQLGDLYDRDTIPVITQSDRGQKVWKAISNTNVYWCILPNKKGARAHKNAHGKTCTLGTHQIIPPVATFPTQATDERNFAWMCKNKHATGYGAGCWALNPQSRTTCFCCQQARNPTRTRDPNPGITMDFQLPKDTAALYLQDGYMVDKLGTIRYEGTKSFSVGGVRIEEGRAVRTGIQDIPKTNFLGTKYFSEAQANAMPKKKPAVRKSTAKKSAQAGSMAKRKRADSNDGDDNGLSLLTGGSSYPDQGVGSSSYPGEDTGTSPFGGSSYIHKDFGSLGYPGEDTGTSHVAGSSYIHKGFGSPSYPGEDTGTSHVAGSSYIHKDFSSPSYPGEDTGTSHVAGSSYIHKDFGSPSYPGEDTGTSHVAGSSYIHKDFGSPSYPGEDTGTSHVAGSSYIHKDFGGPGYSGADASFGNLGSSGYSSNMSRNTPFAKSFPPEPAQAIGEGAQALPPVNFKSKFMKDMLKAAEKRKAAEDDQGELSGRAKKRYRTLKDDRI